MGVSVQVVGWGVIIDRIQYITIKYTAPFIVLQRALDRILILKHIKCPYKYCKYMYVGYIYIHCKQYTHIQFLIHTQCVTKEVLLCEIH